MPRWLHVFSGVAVAVGTTLSAFWILAANSWMQTPVGFTLEGGIAYPQDWFAIIFNPSFPYRLAHMLNASFLTTGFVVLAVGARYRARRSPWRGSAHHAAHGDFAHRGARAAAAPHWRPVTASIRLPTSRPRSPRSRRTGTAASPAISRSSPGLTSRPRAIALPISVPHGSSLDPHSRVERPLSRLEGRAAAGSPAGEERLLRLPHHACRRFLHDRRSIVRRLAMVARPAVRDALVLGDRREHLVGRVCRRHCRLGRHRKRAAAVDRSRLAAHCGRGFAGAGGERGDEPRPLRLGSTLAGFCQDSSSAASSRG